MLKEIALTKVQNLSSTYKSVKQFKIILPLVGRAVGVAMPSNTDQELYKVPCKSNVSKSGT